VFCVILVQEVASVRPIYFDGKVRLCNLHTPPLYHYVRFNLSDYAGFGFKCHA
jgi:hypothetical protein